MLKHLENRRTSARTTSPASGRTGTAWARATPTRNSTPPACAPLPEAAHRAARTPPRLHQPRLRPAHLARLDIRVSQGNECLILVKVTERGVAQAAPTAVQQRRPARPLRLDLPRLLGPLPGTSLLLLPDLQLRIRERVCRCAGSRRAAAQKRPAERGGRG